MHKYAYTVGMPRKTRQMFHYQYTILGGLITVAYEDTFLKRVYDVPTPISESSCYFLIIVSVINSMILNMLRRTSRVRLLNS